MKDSDVKTGMKVKVLNKSTGCLLKNSVEIENAKALGHDYLYVSGYDYEVGCWILSAIRFSKLFGSDMPNGDYFLAKDFVPYNKK